LWAARSGVTASAMTIALIMTLVGVTIPERLLVHQLEHDAAFYAQYYTIQRALVEYREVNGTLPAELKDLKDLPDPGGVIAEALSTVDANGYKPISVLASASTRVKSENLRGRVLRDTGANSSADQPDHGVSFTNYELRLPGEDKILGNDDDYIMRNGVILKVSELSPQSTTVSSHSSAP